MGQAQVVFGGTGDGGAAEFIGGEGVGLDGAVTAVNSIQDHVGAVGGGQPRSRSARLVGNRGAGFGVHLDRERAEAVFDGAVAVGGEGDRGGLGNSIARGRGGRVAGLEGSSLDGERHADHWRCG